MTDAAFSIAMPACSKRYAFFRRTASSGSMFSAAVSRAVKAAAVSLVSSSVLRRRAKPRVAACEAGWVWVMLHAAMSSSAILRRLW